MIGRGLRRVSKLLITMAVVTYIDMLIRIGEGNITAISKIK